MIKNDSLRLRLNQLAADRIPFLFIIDFQGQHPLVFPLGSEPPEVLWAVRGVSGSADPPSGCSERTPVITGSAPLPFTDYKTAFDEVQRRQRLGDSYLLNLTFPTPVTLNCTLEEIFFSSRAPYRLCLKDQFTVFSPEPFVRIEGRVISSYPMKGTINAALADAEKILMDDEKEFAEHLTIVDLIRNDLNSAAENVRVERFRYIERVRARGSELLQTSSEIRGDLTGNWQERLGDLLLGMLPAGSVTGAPKNKTLEIIEAVEGYNRGWYTGVFGIFDGENLDSGVIIRYIEKTPHGYIYKSGGGITVYSEAASEYRELIEKIYVPAC